MIPRPNRVHAGHVLHVLITIIIIIITVTIRVILMHLQTISILTQAVLF